MRSLLRTQLRLAIAVLALVVLPLALLPATFALWPALGSLMVGPIPLPWLLLGLVVYPVTVLVGWRYVRQAERNEREFERIVGPPR
jgi:membrane protein implicated in regulation of membrane protease activity